MRVSQRLFVYVAANLLAALSPPLYARQDDAKAADNSGLKAKEADAKDAGMSLDDVRQLRRKHTTPGKVIEMMAEEGRGFEVTDDVDSELHKLGFSTAQVAAIKDASPDPLVPGKYLSSKDVDRDATMELMQQVANKSGASIQPIASKHMTLWAAKSVQKTYLADLQKAEKFFHAKCVEPIRSGLDKRTTHIVLLNNRAEYAAWWCAILELDPKLFDVKDNPGFSEQIRRDVFKSPAVHMSTFSVICVGEMAPEWRIGASPTA